MTKQEELTHGLTVPGPASACNRGCDWYGNRGCDWDGNRGCMGGVWVHSLVIVESVVWRDRS